VTAPRVLRLALAAVAIAVAALSACGRGKRDAAAPRTPVAAADTVEDAPPVPLGRVSPVEYPQRQWRRGVAGTVVLRLVVDSTGAALADSVVVVTSSGTPALDRAALRAAPSFRYAPALRGGRAVTAALLQPVEFRPHGP
jgi:periplasmic protein TonB